MLPSFTRCPAWLNACVAPSHKLSWISTVQVDKDKAQELMKNVQNKGWISVSISDATQPNLPLVFASEGFFKMTGFVRHRLNHPPVDLSLNPIQNANARTVSGFCRYSPAEILGHSLEKLYGPATDPHTVARISAALQAQEAVSTCILNYRADKTTFWNHLSMQPVIDLEGELR
jgi:hypothetical protein